MYYQAHRGVSNEFPENTMPAFIAAVAQGYEYIETDPYFTKDDKCVLLHDLTLNRTCRNSDGTDISEQIKIADISYEESQKYDAGLFMVRKLKCTKIPLLSELLEFVRDKNVTVKLDNRIQKFNEKQLSILFDEVEKSGTHAAFTCFDISFINKILERFPDAEVHYDGYVDEGILKELKNILGDNIFYVWLCLDSPLTSWVKVPKASKELCDAVKCYAKLGIWILTTDDELERARNLGADIIETAGSLKPRDKKGFFN